MVRAKRCEIIRVASILAVSTGVALCAAQDVRQTPADKYAQLVAILKQSSSEHNVSAQLRAVHLSSDEIVGVYAALASGQVQRQDDPWAMAGLIMVLQEKFLREGASDQQWLALLRTIRNAPLQDNERATIIDGISANKSYTPGGAVALSEALLELASEEQRGLPLRAVALQEASYVLEGTCRGSLLRVPAVRQYLDAPRPGDEHGPGGQATRPIAPAEGMASRLAQAIQSGDLHLAPETLQGIGLLAAQNRRVREQAETWSRSPSLGGLQRAAAQLLASRPSLLDELTRRSAAVASQPGAVGSAATQATPAH